MTNAEQQKIEVANTDRILPPDVVYDLVQKLGGYGSVVDHLKKQGVTNPTTGLAYGRTTIARQARKSAKHEEEMRRRSEAAAKAIQDVQRAVVAEPAPAEPRPRGRRKTATS